MAKKEKKALIVATGGYEFWTDWISKYLRTKNIQSITLEEVLLSGKPLNLKDLVDSVSSVVFLGDSQLIHETITSALVNYSKNVNKAIPVSFPERPGVRFLAEFSDLGILAFEADFNSHFWENLIQRINQ